MIILPENDIQHAQHFADLNTPVIYKNDSLFYFVQASAFVYCLAFHWHIHNPPSLQAKSVPLCILSHGR